MKDNKFSELEVTGIEVPIVDEEKTKVNNNKKVSNKHDKSKTRKIIDTDNELKLEQAVAKVRDGISRYNKSNNKKNTVFLRHNLERTIKVAEKILDSIKE